ncbi:SERTA domain-containing protein 4 [Aulostomus maculatus]
MTLVLSMNPFLDPEGDPPLSYQPIWESEHCTKTCLSNPAPPCSTEEQFTQGTPCRRVPAHVSMSRIAYFKRKFVDDDDDDAPFSIRTYCQTVAPVLEERAHVLRLSLEKMRFIDDPEAFLRRSVLVNNLLRRLRAEILLQSSDWCFPSNPVITTVLPPSTNSSHQVLHRAVPTQICLAPQAGPPFRKRFRMVRAGQGELRPDCAQTCCCIYAAAAAGHYLHLPFSMYDGALSTCPSTPHSSSFFQLAGHSKLGLTVAIEEHDDEDDDAEEEDENEEEEEEEEEDDDDDERRKAGPSIELIKDKSNQKSRTRNMLGHTRTEDSCLTERVEEEEEEEEEGEQDEEEEEERAVRHCQWESGATEGDLHKVHFWHRRGHRQ